MSIVPGIKEVKDVSLEIVAFPDPATDFIKLSIKNYEVKNLRYQLYGINGRILKDNIIENIKVKPQPQ